MTESPVVKGIYSSIHKTQIGAGMTRRTAQVKRFWSVQEEDDGTFSIQALNQNMIAIGQKRPINPEELIRTYTFEPDFFVEQGARAVWRAGDQDLKGAKEDPAALPQKPPITRRVAPDKGQLGEMEGEMASLLQRRREELAQQRREAEDKAEQQARAEFGVALAHLKRGDRVKALQLFEKIATMEGEFAPRHRHMFNEFGIGLRKSNLPDLALKMYRRTLELSPQDDHIYHNMARIHYELGEMAKAVELLQKSLELNPELEMSRRFLEFIDKNRKKFPRFSI